MLSRMTTARLTRWLGILVAAMWLAGFALAAAVAERESERASTEDVDHG